VLKCRAHSDIGSTPFLVHPDRQGSKIRCCHRLSNARSLTCGAPDTQQKSTPLSGVTDLRSRGAGTHEERCLTAHNGGYTYDRSRFFVVPETDVSEMADVLRVSPLKELESGNDLRRNPNTFRHLVPVSPPPPATALLRQVEQRTHVRNQIVEAMVNLMSGAWHKPASNSCDMPQPSSFENSDTHQCFLSQSVGLAWNDNSTTWKRYPTAEGRSDKTCPQPLHTLPCRTPPTPSRNQ
jgi:hypothetical protein